MFLLRRYGGERYEKRDMQIRVRQRFADLQKMDEAAGNVPWHIVNAAQTVEEVTADIWTIVENVLEQVQKGKVVNKMWENGAFQLPETDEGELS
jgi:dTMP kinase